MTSSKVLIVGGNGLLASNWAVCSGETTSICLLSRKHQAKFDGVENIIAGLDDVDELLQHVKSWSPDVIINTAGMTNVDLCETDPEGAYTANVSIAQNVAKVAKTLGVKLVHISTDHLFSGEKALVAEEEEICVLNNYAKTKYEGEQRVAAEYPESLIVRTNFYGWGTAHKQSISDWIINSLRSKEVISAFSDVYFTPLYADQLVMAVDMLLQQNAEGVFNVTSNQRISKYDFAMALAEEFDLDRSLIQNGSINDIELSAQRPRDMSLSNKKAKSIVGESLLDFTKGIRLLKQHEIDGRSQLIKSAFGSSL